MYVFHYLKIVLLIYPGREENAMHKERIGTVKAPWKTPAYGERHKESGRCGMPINERDDRR